MSRYKDELKKILSEFQISGENALSIGNLNDDRKYFKKAEFVTWQTMDCDRDVQSDYLFDLNDDMVENEELSAPDLVEAFDHIFAFELWDYIYDPVTAHRNIAMMLKQGGTYYGSYPFVYPKHNPDTKDMLRYTDDAIKKYLTKFGFGEINIIPRHGNDLLRQFYSKDGMRTKKGFDHSITGWVVKAKK